MVIELSQYRLKVGSFQQKKTLKWLKWPITTSVVTNQLFVLIYLNTLAPHPNIKAKLKISGYIRFRNRLLVNSILGSVSLLYSLLIIAGDIHTNPGPKMENISICHSNIHSIREPDKLLHVDCAFNPKFDIITLSESWLKPTVSYDYLALKGYTN
jgi:hypothetical protein